MTAEQKLLLSIAIIVGDRVPSHQKRDYTQQLQAYKDEVGVKSVGIGSVSICGRCGQESTGCLCEKDRKRFKDGITGEFI